MNTEVTVNRPTLNSPIPVDLLEKVLIQGDLSGLNSEQKVIYYNQVCESLGLNRLTKPFQFMTFNGKEILYAKRECTEQLRKLYHISVKITSRETLDGVYVVTSQAITPDGRTDESTGAVMIQNLRGEALANAFMKAETKSKRRVTLSICGLGMLDETEVEPEVKPETHLQNEGEAYSVPKPFIIPKPIRPEKSLNLEGPKPIGGHSKVIVPPDIINEVKLIRHLQSELGISDEDLKKEVFRKFKTESMKGLKIEELKKLTQILSDEKESRKEEVKEDLPWMKEALNPLDEKIGPFINVYKEPTHHEK